MISVDSARGTKRSCQSCQARYYDLGRNEPACPKCGAAYVEPPRALPTHRVRRPRIPAATPAPAVVVEADAPVMDGGSAEVANVVADEDEDEERVDPEVEAVDKET